MAEIKEVSTGYTPRPLQAKIHAALLAFRFIVLVCHRRFGKTILVINEMIDRMFRCELENPQYAYVAPTYSQAKRIAWEYLKKYTKNIPGRKVYESDLKIEIDRPHKKDKITVQLLGVDNPDSLAGMYLDGIIFDEFSIMSPRIWTTIVRPALADRKGWAIFIGTPRGTNHFYDIYMKGQKSPHWYTSLFRASETGIIPAEELELMKEDMSQEEVDQELECSFSAALLGSYYGKDIEELEKKKKIGKVPYDARFPVYTAWDLGFNDTTAIWFYQLIGLDINVIDYMEDNGKALGHYAKEIYAKPYVIEMHYLPHDANSHDLGSGLTRVETLRDLGIRRTTVLDRIAIQDRIDCVRKLIGRCNFDQENTEELGLAALKNYQKKWDEKRKCFQNKPLHDWSSNGADSFGYMCLSIQGSSGRMKRPTYKPSELCVGDFDAL